MFRVLFDYGKSDEESGGQEDVILRLSTFL